MLLASPPNQFPWQAFIVGTLGIAALAGAAGVCNHLLDHKIDLYMQRTQQRPIAQGRISLSQAGVFALLLGSMGMLILVFAINPLTAWLTLGTSLGYAVFYTLFLKHATPQNIVIGGITGATPPLLGWTAVTGHIDAPSLLLVLIIFTWTPPHFWALAIYRRHEYRRAKIPMLPITHGVAFTKLSILLYTLLMIASTLLPFVIGMSGITYLVSAILLGSAFLYFSCKMLMNSTTVA
jgi:protoheme IX farnesyltransferase